MSTSIDPETTAMVQTLAEDGGPPGAAVGQMVERLRRLEEAWLEGAGRQTLQTLMSARRVLGDRMVLGRLPAAFASE